jgi:hypothetical protein
MSNHSSSNHILRYPIEKQKPALQVTEEVRAAALEARMMRSLRTAEQKRGEA